MSKQTLPLLAVLFSAMLLFVGCVTQPHVEPEPLAGVVNEIHLPYGNIDTNLTAEDLRRIGLNQGDFFFVVAGQNTLGVLWANTYSDVPEGSGVAFLNWEDKVRIARNHANAAETLGLEVGDTFTIVRQLAQ